MRRLKLNAGRWSGFLGGMMMLPVGIGVGHAVEVQLLQYQVGLELGEKLPSEVTPMAYAEGVKISLLLSGEKMIAVKDDSIQVEFLKDAEGEDISKSKLGRALWKQEPFARVTEDGKLGSVTVSFKGEFAGRIEKSVLKGSLEILTGSQKEEDQVVLKKDEKKGVAAGPLEVTWSSGKGFFGGGQKGISVKGDLTLIEKLEVEVDGKREESRQSSWSGDTKTFFFDGELGDEVTVHLTRWTDLKVEKVPFEVVVGAAKK